MGLFSKNGSSLTGLKSVLSRNLFISRMAIALRATPKIDFEEFLFKLDASGLPKCVCALFRLFGTIQILFGLWTPKFGSWLCDSKVLNPKFRIWSFGSEVFGFKIFSLKLWVWSFEWKLFGQNSRVAKSAKFLSKNYRRCLLCSFAHSNYLKLFSE